MSYDFWLFPAGPSVEDYLATANRTHGGSPKQEMDTRILIQKVEARKRTLADVVMRLNPLMTALRFQYDKIAEMQKITIEGARRAFRHIELDGPDDGKGIQIMLFDDYATVDRAQLASKTTCSGRVPRDMGLPSCPSWHLAGISHTTHNSIGCSISTGTQPAAWPATRVSLGRCKPCRRRWPSPKSRGGSSGKDGGRRHLQAAGRWAVA